MAIPLSCKSAHRAEEPLTLCWRLGRSYVNLGSGSVRLELGWRNVQCGETSVPLGSKTSPSVPLQEKAGGKLAVRISATFLPPDAAGDTFTEMSTGSDQVSTMSMGEDLSDEEDDGNGAPPALGAISLAPAAMSAAPATPAKPSAVEAISYPSHLNIHM